MTTTPLASLWRWRWRIFALTWLAYAGFYLCRKNFSVVMPYLIEELGYTKTDFANVVFVYSLMYMLGQFACGMMSDRFGPRLIVGAGLFISMFANIWMGFTTSLGLFLVLNAINGAGQSTGWSGTVKNMSAWFQHHERGVVMGWWGTCYVLGGMAGTSFATYASHGMPWFEELAWRRGFWVPAAAIGVIGVLYAIWTRNKPSDTGLPDFPEEAGEGPEVELRDEAGRESVLAEVLASPVLWVASITYFFLKLTRYAFLFWLPLYMVEALGYEKTTAGYASTIYEFVGFTGVILAGYVSDRRFQSRRFPVASVMLFGLAAACLVHPSLAALGFYGNLLGIGLIGMMTFGPDAILSGPAAQDIGSQRGAATAAGFINGVGSIGQLLSGYVVAIVSDRYGWDAVFYIFVVFGLIAGALTATKWNYGGRKPDAAAA